VRFRPPAFGSHSGALHRPASRTGSASCALRCRLGKPGGRCDVVLRYGLPNDPGMVARKMAMTTRVLCAAPSYLNRHGTPHSPDDLLRHSCLRLARRHHLDDLWRLRRDGSEFEVRVRGNLSSGDGAVLHEWALSGEGISWEAFWDVSEDLASGRLVLLLPEYQSSPMELYAILRPASRSRLAHSSVC
jgi:LysR family transcriptional activator of dmlA